MKKTLAIAAILLVCGPAGAQVEPRVAGDWQLVGDGQAKSLHLGRDGKYHITSNGQVVDCGSVSVKDGNVNLRSDSGKQDQGRFSIIGGELKMYGGGLDGSWRRSGATSTSTKSGSTSSLPLSSLGSSAAKAYPASTPSSLPLSSLGQSSARTVIPESAPASMPLSSLGQTPAKSVPTLSTPVSQPLSSLDLTPSTSSAPVSSPAAASSESSIWSATSQSASSPSSSSISGSVKTSTSATPSSGPSKGKKFFGMLKDKLSNVNFDPSVLSGAAPSSSSPNSQPASARAFTTPSAAQRYYGAPGMPRRSGPEGIPVMKDGTARKIRFGH